ncbi:MAG: hypothetical protein US25_C0043G0005 [Candidatus Moranbacteria bacterium GW2011_GWE1_36_7]|nr:MAG: hypothetical protein UR99_C0009G0014 [Candidatus Moranbacteria bacterium GW2011_GWD2_36_12]KKQ06787.1 MAG: hypothetical protein US16_C0009G0014 [Candidatus Moranbacteria bacterium GW2011_GWE2_36_40]KKQ13029.1 MAG: hypothetical protein US25_C0043G0005 [Candidatus Moranbacteria bacterium GW2011_GWE1_36_7]
MLNNLFNFDFSGTNISIIQPMIQKVNRKTFRYLDIKSTRHSVIFCSKQLGLRLKRNCYIIYTDT